MNTEQALQFITNALNTANLKGVFGLQDANNAVIAINILNQLNNQYEDQLEITKDLMKYDEGYISRNVYDKLHGPQEQIETLVTE